jgi:hypothetical protein
MGRLRTLVNGMSLGESIVAFAIAVVAIIVVFNL